MLSSLANSASLVGAHTACNPLASADIERWLGYADWGLAAIGAALAIIALTRGAARLQAIHVDDQSDAPFMPPIEALFLPVLAYLGVILVLYPLVGHPPQDGDSRDAAKPLDLGALLTTHAALAAGGITCWLVGRRWLRTEERSFVIGDGTVSRNIGRGVAGAIIAIALCQSLLLVTMLTVQSIDPACEFPEHGVIDALRDPRCPAWLPAAMWFGVTTVTPFAEELFFRGILLGTLVRGMRRRWLAIVVAGCIFGIAHSSQPQVIPALSLFGVILGVIYLRTGSLVGPITAHALFNAKTLLWETLRASS